MYSSQQILLRWGGKMKMKWLGHEVGRGEYGGQCIFSSLLNNQQCWLFVIYLIFICSKILATVSWWGHHLVTFSLAWQITLQSCARMQWMPYYNNCSSFISYLFVHRFWHRIKWQLSSDYNHVQGCNECHVLPVNNNCSLYFW